MRRRDFVRIAAGSALAWPSVGLAQSPGLRVGFLHPGSGASDVAVKRIAAFNSGLNPANLREAGGAEIVTRFADDQLDRLPALAAELVQQGVHAICAAAPPAVRAARQTTSSVPIIAMDLESDPIKNGWATSLAHPGGNVTGIFLDVPGFSAKVLELLREAIGTSASKIAVLWHPAGGTIQVEAVRAAAAPLNVSLQVFEVNAPSDFDSTCQAMAKAEVAGVLILSSPLVAYNSQLLADLTLRNRLPAISFFPDFAQNGGLIAYGPDLQSLYPQAGAMARKLLQGVSAGNLPIERPTIFRMVVNLKTAHALGVSPSTSTLLRADEVIE